MGLTSVAAFVVLQYLAPLATESPEPGDFSFSRFAAGEHVYVADEGVSLRATPDEAAASVATLPMGQEVRVRQPGKAVAVVGGLVNRWYEVEVGEAPAASRSGFVFGGSLTPLRFVADLDGDGRDEVVTAAFTAAFLLRVRVWKPGVIGEGRVAWHDFKPSGQDFLKQRGGEASVQLLPASEAGVPLIAVDSWREACSDFWRAYLSYTAVPPAGADRPGRLQVALELHGVNDPPVGDNFEVTFQPTAKAVLVVRKIVDQDKHLRLIHQTKRQRYRLRDGRFVDEHRPGR